MDPRPNSLFDSTLARHAQPRQPLATGMLQSLQSPQGLTDAALPSGAISELFYRQDSGGELQLLMPMLARLSQQKRWIVFMAPPTRPEVSALSAAGVNLSRILVIHPSKIKSALKTLAQALASGNCSAVLAWPKSLSQSQLQCLQQAAQKGDTVGIMLQKQPRQQTVNKVVTLTFSAHHHQTQSTPSVASGDVIQGPWQA